MAEPFRGAGGRPPAGELARSLAHRLEDILPMVLGDCRFDPAEGRGHGSDGALWVVARRGAKRGVALCASEPNRSGDMLQLVAEALYGGDARQAYAWALERCRGIAAPPAAAVARRAEDDAAERETRRRRALGRYLAGEHRIAGTPVEAYLRGRGIEELPAALRFHADCHYAGRQPAPIEAYPAMLAPVIEPMTREFRACHATYLAPAPGGGWGKARLHPARKAWGPVKGGLIPLRRGASGKRLRHMLADEELLLGEGIENTLSAAVMRPELRAAAAVSSGNLAELALPEQLIGVVLVMDRDGENEGTRRAYDRAIDRWLHEGRGVATLKPPAGHEDMNAWLQAIRQETGE